MPDDGLTEVSNPLAIEVQLNPELWDFIAAVANEYKISHSEAVVKVVHAMLQIRRLMSVSLGRDSESHAVVQQPTPTAVPEQVAPGVRLDPRTTSSRLLDALKDRLDLPTMIIVVTFLIGAILAVIYA